MPDPAPLESLEIGVAPEDAELSVILMHGLGADGHDFADVAAMLTEAAKPARWRFVLPHAGKLPVTLNMGMIMPAWYDIIDLSHPRAVDWDTVAASQKQIESLIDKEPAPQLVLAGFSQGGAMALHVGLRHQPRLAGIATLSGYLLESEEHPVPAKQHDLPIGLFHGTDDEVVPLSAAETARQSLAAADYSPTLRSYPGLPHSVSQEEIRDLFEWLTELSP